MTRFAVSSAGVALLMAASGLWAAESKAPAKKSTAKQAKAKPNTYSIAVTGMF